MNFCVVFALLIVAQIATSLQATTSPLSANSTAEVGKNKFKIVCYYHLHSFYTPGYRDYLPEVIDENKCSHIIYTDRVSYRNLNVTARLHDGKKVFYERVVDLRKKGIFVSISFFKFKFLDFARSLNGTDDRTRFVTSLVEYIEQYHFDGFEFFWGCRTCSTDDPDEKSMDLLRQLSEAFKPHGWLLSTYIAPNKTMTDAGLGIHKISEQVDWITVRTINLPEKSTTHAAPLYFYPGDTEDQLNSNWSITYLIEKGVPSHKLLLPVATFGSSFQLTSAEENGLKAPIKNHILNRQFYEICNETVRSDWTFVHDTNRIGSYAYWNEEWNSYDDTEDVQRKAEYIIEMKLGGGAILNLNGDDFQERCGCTKNPLLTAMYQVLRNVDAPKIKNCT